MFDVVRTSQPKVRLLFVCCLFCWICFDFMVLIFVNPVFVVILSYSFFKLTFSFHHCKSSMRLVRHVPKNRLVPRTLIITESALYLCDEDYSLEWPAGTPPFRVLRSALLEDCVSCTPKKKQWKRLEKLTGWLSFFFCRWKWC